jgi:nicotinamidase-related amidase
MTSTPAIDPARTALLLMDFQSGIVDSFPGSDALLQRAAAAREIPDTVVTKTRVGAFSTTDLADQLAARGIDTVVLSGIATSGVVLSTIRDAADHDYRLFVLADCCGDRDEEVHRLLLDRVFVRQADTIESADLGELLGAPGPG